MYCPKCGNRVKNNARFCKSCGHHLTQKNIRQAQQPTSTTIIHTHSKSLSRFRLAYLAVPLIMLLTFLYVINNLENFDFTIPDDFTIRPKEIIKKGKGLIDDIVSDDPLTNSPGDNILVQPGLPDPNDGNQDANQGTGDEANRSKFVGETIPDNTVFSPSENFIKSWTIRNEGTETWTTDYSFRHTQGTTFGSPEITYLPQEVKPGELTEIQLDLRAPDEPGTYTGRWELFDGYGNNFGWYSTVIIVDGNPSNNPGGSESYTVEDFSGLNNYLGSKISDEMKDFVSTAPLKRDGQSFPQTRSIDTERRLADGFDNGWEKFFAEMFMPYFNFDEEEHMHLPEGFVYDHDQFDLGWGFDILFDAVPYYSSLGFRSEGFEESGLNASDWLSPNENPYGMELPEKFIIEYVLLYPYDYVPLDPQFFLPEKDNFAHFGDTERIRLQIIFEHESNRYFIEAFEIHRHGHKFVYYTLENPYLEWVDGRRYLNPIIFPSEGKHAMYSNLSECKYAINGFFETLAWDEDCGSDPKKDDFKGFWPRANEIYHVEAQICTPTRLSTIGLDSTYRDIAGVTGEYHDELVWGSLNQFCPSEAAKLAGKEVDDIFDVQWNCGEFSERDTKFCAANGVYSKFWKSHRVNGAYNPPWCASSIAGKWLYVGYAPCISF